jgi:hypothetical protein
MPAALIALLYPSLRLLGPQQRAQVYKSVMTRTHCQWVSSRTFLVCCAASLLAVMLLGGALRPYMPEFWLPVPAITGAYVIWFSLKWAFYRPIMRREAAIALEPPINRQ